MEPDLSNITDEQLYEELQSRNFDFLEKIDEHDLFEELNVRYFDWVEKISDSDIISEVSARALESSISYNSIEDYTDKELKEELYYRDMDLDPSSDELREIKQFILKNDLQTAIQKIDYILPDTHRYLDH